jgi:hypothetical protein
MHGIRPTYLAGKFARHRDMPQSPKREALILDVLIPEAGAFYVMDRGFFDLQRLHRLAQAAAFFVIRTKTNLQFRRV